MRKESVISRNPDVLGGTPVFARTRVPVQTLVDHLRAGDRLDEFLDDFPCVTREQAEAFLQLADQAVVADIEPS